MHMENAQDRNQTAKLIASAIMSVEYQLEISSRNQSSEAKAKRERFFALLDQLSPRVFDRITEQAKKNEHIFYLNALPNFRAQCDEIFGLGFGDFPSEAVNEWLYARDLKHLFHCNGNTLVW